MAAVQLTFTLRTSARCKTVHLIGSWDSYRGQIPLSKDHGKSGAWKGTFRFQGQNLQPGQKYWYYYIIDGYHVSHDPAQESVVEPTTGRKLNVLIVPPDKLAAAVAAAGGKPSRHARHDSLNGGVPKGYPLPKSSIISPKPYNPQETRLVRTEQFERATMEKLATRFAGTQLSDSESDVDSDVPSLSSSRSTNSSSPSSVSSTSSCCTCERYGITRSGDRVKLDCGGARCGSPGGSECSSESEGEKRPRATRRQGIMVRK